MTGGSSSRFSPEWAHFHRQSLRYFKEFRYAVCKYCVLDNVFSIHTDNLRSLLSTDAHEGRKSALQYQMVIEIRCEKCRHLKLHCTEAPSHEKTWATDDRKLSKKRKSDEKIAPLSILSTLFHNQSTPLHPQAGTQTSPASRSLLYQASIREYRFAGFRVRYDHMEHSRHIAEAIACGKASINFICSPFFRAPQRLYCTSDNLLERNNLLLYPSKVQNEMMSVRYNEAVSNIRRRLKEGSIALEGFTISDDAWS